VSGEGGDIEGVGEMAIESPRPESEVAVVVKTCVPAYQQITAMNTRIRQMRRVFFCIR